jgi:hypothetical protein
MTKCSFDYEKADLGSATLPGRFMTSDTKCDTQDRKVRKR